MTSAPLIPLCNVTMRVPEWIVLWLPSCEQWVNPGPGREVVDGAASLLVVRRDAKDVERTVSRVVTRCATRTCHSGVGIVTCIFTTALESRVLSRNANVIRSTSIVV